VPAALDEQILRDAAAFFERGEKMQLDYHVRNVQRAIGTRASSHIVRKYGMDWSSRGPPLGHTCKAHADSRLARSASKV